MKKLLILTTLMVLAFAMIANATTTRLQTLGNNDQVLLDDANVFMYPSRTLDYPNWAIGEFGYNDGSNEFSNFGVMWKFGEEANPWVLGTFFSNNAPWVPGYSVSTPWFSNFYSVLPYTLDDFEEGYIPNRRVDVFYGRKLGETPFGFHLGIISSSVKYEEAGQEEYNEGFANYSLGFGATLNEGKMDIAGGVDYLTWTDEYWDGAAVVEESKPKGNMSLWGSMRMFREAGAFTHVPHVSLRLNNSGIEWPDGTESTVKDFIFDAGWGWQWAPTQDASAMFDAGFRYDKLTEEVGTAKDNFTTFSLPYFKVGMEGKVFDWMWARFGSTSFWNNQALESETFDEKLSWKYPQNETIVGLGFVFNRLHVDCNVNPELFLEGFNFISGRNNDMNFNFSVLYDLH